jgi:DNA-binding CsgD family transcriptional regulator
LSQADEYFELLPRIFEIGSGNWDPLLDGLKEYLAGSAIALVSHDFKNRIGSIPFASGYNREYLRSYALYYARHNVWLEHERDYRSPGAIHIGADLVSEYALVGSRFYTEWLQPQDLHHRLCAVLSRERATAVFLDIMRPRSGPGFTGDDVERCRALLPHVQRALRMHRRIAELEIERDAAFHALDHLPWGVVFVDERRNRLGANRHAQEILLAGDGLMSRGGSLKAALAEEDARLNRLLSSALRRTGDSLPSVGGPLSITRPSGAHPLSVVVVPLRTKADALGDRIPAAAIFVSDPDVRLDSSNEQHLRELYALTAGEARLAAWLSQGKSVDAAASAMGISVNTARAYLKRIYGKTGVRRQPELVRLLLLGLPRLREVWHQEHTGK